MIALVRIKFQFSFNLILFKRINIKEIIIVKV